MNDDLMRLAQSYAEDHSRATADRPGAEVHCDYCGSADPDGLVPGPDGGPVMVCRDLDGCIARRERRYPPDPGKIPGWLADWLTARQRRRGDARWPGERR